MSAGFAAGPADFGLTPINPNEHCRWCHMPTPATLLLDRSGRDGLIYGSGHSSSGGGGGGGPSAAVAVAAIAAAAASLHFAFDYRQYA